MNDSSHVAETPTEFEFWGQLPKNVKENCVGWMDFRQRSELRCTARAEKALVDTFSDYKFSMIAISKEDLEITSEDSYLDPPIKIEKIRHKLTNVLAYLFENNDIEHLCIRHAPELDFEALDKLIPDHSIRAEKLEVCIGNMKGTEFFIKKCWDRVNYMAIFLSEYNEKVANFYTLSAIEHTAKLRIERWPRGQMDVTHIVPLVRSWIKNDVEIGRFALIGNFNFTEFSKLSELLYDNKMFAFSDEKMLRLRTDNPQKQILMLRRETELYRFFCAVIPCDLHPADCYQHSLDLEGQEDEPYF